jgi:hypothetical protein
VVVAQETVEQGTVELIRRATDERMILPIKEAMDMISAST